MFQPQSSQIMLSPSYSYVWKLCELDEEEQIQVQSDQVTMDIRDP